MARASVIMNFDMFYQIEFKTAIRGHHVYKQTWTPSLGEILQCKKDNRQEALDHDEHAVGVYKFESDDAETMLARGCWSVTFRLNCRCCFRDF